MNKEILFGKLRDIECQLSPENLTWDGERPLADVRRDVDRLERERNKIIAQLGYEPTVQEVFKGYTF